MGAKYNRTIFLPMNFYKTNTNSRRVDATTVTSNELICDTTLQFTKNPVANYVLTSDSLGNGSWVALSGLGVTSITGTASEILVNGTSGTSQIGACTLTLPSSIDVTTMPNLTSIGTTGQALSIANISVPSSSWVNVANLNQSVASYASPSFVNVYAALVGNVTGNCSGTSSSVTSATQSAITTIPSLTSIGSTGQALSIAGVSISSTIWNSYVSTMNQSVSYTAAPTFTGLTINGNVGIYGTVDNMLTLFKSTGYPGIQVGNNNTYRGKYLGCDDVKLPNGTTMTIPKSTADLDVAEFGEYFDKVQADCAERGIYLADLG